MCRHDQLYCAGCNQCQHSWTYCPVYQEASKYFAPGLLVKNNKIIVRFGLELPKLPTWCPYFQHNISRRLESLKGCEICRVAEIRQQDIKEETLRQTGLNLRKESSAETKKPEKQVRLPLSQESDFAGDISASTKSAVVSKRGRNPWLRELTPRDVSEDSLPLSTL